MSWHDDQRRLAAAVLAAEVDERTWDQLGGDPARWQVYRRLVRSRLQKTIEHAFAGLVEALGEDAFARLFEAFLMHGQPRSPYLRDVPGELLRFVESASPATSGREAWPPYAIDLARYEWALLDVAYDPGTIDRTALGPLVMDAVAVIHPAHRLLHLGYPVHRAEGAAELAAMAPEPTALCVYRDAVSHEVETLELTPVAAAILLGIASRRSATLTEVVRDAAAACGASVDVPFVEALTELLASLVERGVLLGSIAGSEKSS